MIVLRVLDKKEFTSGLFMGEMFDHFWAREVMISTYNTFTIDGRLQKGYYSQEETQEYGERFSQWSQLRPVCFSLIKGKRLPGSFKITLQLSKQDHLHFIATRELSIKENQITGLYLNIRYEDGELYVTTGTSLTFFDMEKLVESEWDEFITQFLKDQGICVDQL